MFMHCLLCLVAFVSYVDRDPCFPLISVDVCVCSISFCVNKDALGALYSVLNRSESFLVKITFVV
jgi:hypothetical protein